MSINIKFPLTSNSKKGYFLELTETKKEAVKSNILFLLSTQKGERLYKPEFGTNLRSFIFEQLDDQTVLNIKEEIQSSILKNMQGITIDQISVEQDNITNSINIDINFSFTQGAFKYSDIVSFSI